MRDEDGAVEGVRAQILANEVMHYLSYHDAVVEVAQRFGFEGIDAGVTSILWDNHMTPALIFNRLAQLHARGVHLDQQHFPGLS